MVFLCIWLRSLLMCFWGINAFVVGNKTMTHRVPNRIKNRKIPKQTGSSNQPIRKWLFSRKGRSRWSRGYKADNHVNVNADDAVLTRGICGRGEKSRSVLYLQAKVTWRLCNPFFVFPTYFLIVFNCLNLISTDYIDFTIRK